MAHQATIHYEARDVEAIDLGESVYDAVWFNGSLHHVEALERVLGNVPGWAFACGWFPESPHRRYLPGHRWIMATLSGLVALFFLYCSVRGFRQGRKDSRR